MSFAYRIDSNLKLVFCAGLGVTTGQEMLRTERDVSRDPSRLSCMKIVIDLSHAKPDISLADIRDALAMNKARVANGGELEATAFVSRSRFAKALGDTFRLLGQGLPLKFSVFSTLPDAVRWLGLAEHEDEVVALQRALVEQLHEGAGGT